MLGVHKTERRWQKRSFHTCFRVYHKASFMRFLGTKKLEICVKATHAGVSLLAVIKHNIITMSKSKGTIVFMQIWCRDITDVG